MSDASDDHLPTLSDVQIVARVRKVLQEIEDVWDEEDDLLGFPVSLDALASVLGEFSFVPTAARSLPFADVVMSLTNTAHPIAESAIDDAGLILQKCRRARYENLAKDEVDEADDARASLVETMTSFLDALESPSLSGPAQ